MHVKKVIFGAWLAMASATTCLAADTHPAAQLERFSAQAARPAQVEGGRIFFLNKHGNDWSCASCHGEVPTQTGRHATTGKVIAPLAPAFNAKSLTDTVRVDKWFRRNCKDVLARECTAGEKADVLAWLISLK